MKFEPLVKSENHELFLINDNSKIETEKIKLISDFSLQNPELPDPHPFLRRLNLCGHQYQDSEPD